MKNAIAGVPYSTSKEIAETQKYLASGTMNKQDTATATAYLNSLIKDQPTVTENSTANTAAGKSIYAGLGMSDEDIAILEAYQNNPTNNSTDTATQQGITGGDGSNSVLGWIQSKSGDVAIVVLGMLVIGVALFTSTRVRETIITTASKAAGVPT